MFSDTQFIAADCFVFCQCFSFVWVLCCLELPVAKRLCFAYLLKAALTARVHVHCFSASKLIMCFWCHF